jgi:hypothetical protein
VSTVEQKGKRAPAEGQLDHFKNLLKGPCLNHAYPIKHAYKDCSLMKQFLCRGSSKGDQKKKPDPSVDDTEEKEGAFPKTMGCLIIFDAMASYDSKRR